jgi:hypothetical protein
MRTPSMVGLISTTRQIRAATGLAPSHKLQTLAGALLLLCLAHPLPAVAADAFVCAELKAAVADAPRHFASYRGGAIAPTDADIALSKSYREKNYQKKSYQAKKTMTGAKSCSVVDVSMEEPKRRVRDTVYSCQYPAGFKLDKALRTQLTRCIAGEADDGSSRYDFAILVDPVSSGEGVSATEVKALMNPVDGLTLSMRQTVCTNKGNSKACED